MNTETRYIAGIPAKLYYEGSPERAVLAVHGFGGSKDSLAIQGLAERLCPAGYLIAAPDLPCHGERTEPETELTPERCLSDISGTLEKLRRKYPDISAFATSFGGCCILRLIELYGNPFRKIVLRVPAVNMAASLLSCMKLFNPDFRLENAKADGFHIKMSREMNIPFEFYEKLTQLNEVRFCQTWNIPYIMTIYAGCDELVSRNDTEEFLRLNPLIKHLCIKESGHRMNQKPEYLQQALDSAAEFIKTI